MEIKYRDINDLIHYKRNAKLHPESQVAKIAKSIQEFGFRNPVLVDSQDEIIAGHGRVMAAKQAELTEVPVIRADDLTPEQVRAYRIADNKLAESEWSDEILKIEVGNLHEVGFDLELIGLSEKEIKEMVGEGSDDPYSKKVDAPIYEPSGDCPQIYDLFNDIKTVLLRQEIDIAGLPKDISDFLKKAAERHTVFNFSKIADYYAHASPDVQGLMEKSALVIIDFEKAIEEGFVNLNKEVAKEYTKDSND